MKKITLWVALMSLGSLSAQNSLRVNPGPGTQLYDINDTGQGVGNTSYYDYATNTYTPKESEASWLGRINNAGDVAGKMNLEVEGAGNIEQAAYKKGGVWTAIGYFPGDVPGSGWFSQANAISNNSKYVTGQIATSAAGNSRPFIYDTETHTLTKITNGDTVWDYARGEGVNSYGVVSGFADKVAENLWIPVYFDAGGMVHYIDGGTVEFGEAADINDSGKVVGYKGGKAFIYDITTGVYKSFGSTNKISNPIFTSISENGVVLGYEGDLGSRNAIIYSEQMTEPMLLTEYLAYKGADLSQLANTVDGKLGTGMGISPDGKYLCGFDNTAPPVFAAGWIVHLDEIPTDPGCLDAPNGMNPSTVFIPVCNGDTETITAAAKTGEYSLVQLTAGKKYTFSSSVATDIITIANEEGTQIIKYGTGSVSYMPAADQVVRFSLNLDGNCSYSSELRTKTLSCMVPLSCEWTVHVFDNSGNLGDEVVWNLKDEDGNVLLSGGGYGADYDDTQTVSASGPLTFYISSAGFWGDNTPSYTVSNGTEELVSGSLNPENQEETYSDLNCTNLAVSESNKADFKYYPNPVSEFLKISSEKTVRSVSVYSLDGKIVVNRLINMKNPEIDLRSLQSGAYVVTVNFTEGQIRSFKILKK